MIKTCYQGSKVTSQTVTHTVSDLDRDLGEIIQSNEEVLFIYTKSIHVLTDPKRVIP